MSEQLGILGTGHLATYVVTGLRNAGDNRPILLAPRNRERALHLQQEQACEIAKDNQQVVDQCPLLLLAVRPAQVDALLQELSFKPGQLIISCVAGVPLQKLQDAVAPAQVVRTMPLACAEVGSGAVPLYPDHPKAHKLLERLGKLLPFDSEEQFELAATAACMNGWVYAFLDEVSGWFAKQGLTDAQARELVTHSVLGAADLAAAKPALSLRAICDSIATDGTFTRLGLNTLEKQKAFQPWQEACQQVKDALEK
ncbi:NAD(P)-binding domain-containing protein [Marinobacterium sp. D7]|uniref:NAD(P)-binding domain-containing protein n=1 Tax=Marinobacterium ramblicola TaxID=2849041 RepID=UPI001C2DD99A|nr:NAD(P)-binding domain-containing protein [Marinobacterium ramblicola]MBV1788646.1 NAD(P)-binding domain-containing protein [Marinobacterium ramblicola]